MGDTPTPHPAAGPPAPEVLHDQDFITVYRGLDRELCRAITERFDQDAGKRRGKIIGGAGRVDYDAQTKNSWDLEIRPDGAWRDLFTRIHPPIQACINHYLARSPVLQSFDLEGTGYKIQMYPKGEGYFRWHADSMGRHHGNRVVAMVLYLNDVAKGGETAFFHQDLEVPPRAGRLVLFPTGWNYMHSGQVPESGSKYIIQTFIRTKV